MVTLPQATAPAAVGSGSWRLRAGAQRLPAAGQPALPVSAFEGQVCRRVMLDLTLAKARPAPTTIQWHGVSRAGQMGQLLTVNGQIEPALALPGLPAWLIARDGMPADEAIAWDGPRPAAHEPLPAAALTDALAQPLVFGGGMMGMGGWPDDLLPERTAC